MKFDYDVAIIGGGSGGYAAARTCAAAGKKTVVIEGGQGLQNGDLIKLDEEEDEGGDK